jgi:hypothetical protein
VLSLFPCALRKNTIQNKEFQTRCPSCLERKLKKKIKKCVTEKGNNITQVPVTYKKFPDNEDGSGPRNVGLWFIAIQPPGPAATPKNILLYLVTVTAFNCIRSRMRHKRQLVT